MDFVVVFLYNKVKFWKKKERKFLKFMERLQNYLMWLIIWVKRCIKQLLSCINDLYGWILINCYEYC